MATQLTPLPLGKSKAKSASSRSLLRQDKDAAMSPLAEEKEKRVHDVDFIGTGTFQVSRPRPAIAACRLA